MRPSPAETLQTLPSSSRSSFSPLIRSYGHSTRNTYRVAVLGHAQVQHIAAHFRKPLDVGCWECATDFQAGNFRVGYHDLPMIVAIEFSRSIGKRCAMEYENAASPGERILQLHLFFPPDGHP